MYKCRIIIRILRGSASRRSDQLALVWQSGCQYCNRPEAWVLQVILRVVLRASMLMCMHFTHNLCKSYFIWKANAQFYRRLNRIRFCCSIQVWGGQARVISVRGSKLNFTAWFTRLLSTRTEGLRVLLVSCVVFSLCNNCLLIFFVSVSESVNVSVCRLRHCRCGGLINSVLTFLFCF